MAEQPVNNRQPGPREDGRMTSDLESNNGRRGGRNQATSSRHPSPRRIPSPRRATSQISSPRRIASQIHIPVNNREHKSAYDIMDIVIGQMGRLDRLESDFTRQREVEEQLRQEQAWRK
ncbi:hypothetical protein PIB30_011345 [Stylosanthes scabra]|uniref:Uncharacterized protein n=1 Tax=Stylosanthes scabra TaxID=79078 RepID=A0ABU6W5C3_9FABA|nr:hypothetical protein [Stylosanthes scabra]